MANEGVGTRCEPVNFTLMGVNSISPAHPHAQRTPALAEEPSKIPARFTCPPRFIPPLVLADEKLQMKCFTRSNLFFRSK